MKVFYHNAISNEMADLTATQSSKTTQEVIYA